MDFAGNLTLATSATSPTVVAARLWSARLCHERTRYACADPIRIAVAV